MAYSSMMNICSTLALTVNCLLMVTLTALGLSACSDRTEDDSSDHVAVSVTYNSPRELIAEMNRLQSGACGLSCQMAIAGMHSTEFLKSQRDAVMYGISNPATRREMTLMFFGAEIPLKELQAITDQEFFARQLLHLERTLPADVVLRRIEIVSEKDVGEREVQMVVVRSGLGADSDYAEEGLMNFILEDDGWKIKN